MEQPNIPDGHLDIIFYHGAHPLWVYLKEVAEIDILDVCPRVAKESPILKTDRGDLSISLVDVPFEKQVGPMFNNDVIFLLNSINIVYESLRAGIEKDGVKILETYKFKLDKSHNMFLIDIDSEVPISSKALAVVKL